MHRCDGFGDLAVPGENRAEHEDRGSIRNTRSSSEQMEVDGNDGAMMMVGDEEYKWWQHVTEAKKSKERWGSNEIGLEHEMTYLRRRGTHWREIRCGGEDRFWG